MIFVITEISTAKCVRGWRNLINDLFWSQEGRCLAAYESEMSRKHLPKEYR